MTNGIANAGTSKRVGSNIAPTLKERLFGTGTLTERFERGLRVLDPNFRAVQEREEVLGLRERQVGVQESRLQLAEGAAEAERRNAGETIVLSRQFPNAPPATIEFITNQLRLKGVEVSPEGRANKRALVETLQNVDPEIFQEGFRVGIEQLDKGIAGLDSQIQVEGKRLAEKLKIPVKQVLENPQMINSDKKLAELIRTRDLNEQQLTGLNTMSMSLAEEQKEAKSLASQLTGETRNLFLQIKGDNPELTDEQALAEANRRRQEQKVEVGAAGVVAKAEARADLPIPTNELIKFVDENGFFPPANLTPNQAEELGFFPISEGSKQQVLSAGNVGSIIKEMTPIVDRLFQAAGFWNRVTGAFPNLKAYFLQEGNEQLVVDASFYMALKHGVAGQFSKVVSGEGGRLTEQDIQRVLGLFPTFFNSVFLADTKAVAQRKMQFLSRRLEDERKRILDREGLKPTGTLTEATENFVNITTTEASEQLIDIGDRDLSQMSIEELIELKRGQ